MNVINEIKKNKNDIINLKNDNEELELKIINLEEKIKWLDLRIEILNNKKTHEENKK